MELTVNLNVTNWYTNSESNPKEYWPLDYPPASGYYSYICGLVIQYFLPESVMLHKSWGFESSYHKQLMRLSVVVSDLIFFHIPVWLICRKLFSKNISQYYTGMILFLLSPMLMIIDHGHFQYNCVMHGLFILSVYLLYCNKFLLTIFVYTICINFKQMGLYFALPFPVYVIKYLYSRHGLFSFRFILRIAICGFVTVMSMLLVWFPWAGNSKDVLTRIFPLWRGIFEDKVYMLCNLGRYILV
jgi:alpha-1,3-glucosyltransferase